MNTDTKRKGTWQDVALGADFLGLIEAFKTSGPFISTEMMLAFTKHWPAKAFEDLGWIEPAQCGRFLRGWKPAGKVAECLARANAERGTATAELPQGAAAASAFRIPHSALGRGCAA